MTDQEGKALQPTQRLAASSSEQSLNDGPAEALT
jgi:hypothetical protein